MLACFLHFEEEVVLILGLTPNDVMLMSTGASPPLMDLGELAKDFDCGLPSRMQVVWGVDEDAIQEKISQSLESSGNENAEREDVPSEKLEQYLKEASISPAHVAANASEELAIKRAQAKLN